MSFFVDPGKKVEGCDNELCCCKSLCVHHHYYYIDVAVVAIVIVIVVYEPPRSICRIVIQAHYNKNMSISMIGIRSAY